MTNSQSPDRAALADELTDWFDNLDFDRSNITTRQAEFAALMGILSSSLPGGADDDVIKKGRSLVAHLSAVLERLPGQAYSSTLSAMNDFSAAVDRAALRSPSPYSQTAVTDEMVTAAMREFERMSSVLRYREKDKWHSCDIMGMRDALRAAFALLPEPSPYSGAAGEALRDNLREAWSALAMIRETVETLAPSGSVKAAEHLDGPTFMHEADALVAGIVAIPTTLSRDAERETIARVIWMQFCPGLAASDEDKKRYLECADAILAKFALPSIPSREGVEQDALEYALGALRAIAASGKDTTASQLAAFAQAGIDAATNAFSPSPTSVMPEDS